jgi:DNA (cytosine-5)-methyltransferase 1
VKTHLDLFSGIGGFALAAGWAGYNTIGFCEIEDYPRRVLSKRFSGVPIHGDIRELDGSVYRGVSLITGGYPCQPFSAAGKRGGASDDRHLWPQMLRVIKQARPVFVVAENVAGHITLGLDEVLADLESEGYAGRAIVVPACAVNAPHRRDRVWIIARNVDDAQSAGGGRVLRNLPSADAIQRQPQKCGQDQARQFVDAGEDMVNSDNSGDRASRRRTDSIRQKVKQGQEKQSQPKSSGSCKDVAHSGSGRRQGGELQAGRNEPGLCGHERIGSSYWETEPAVGRVADGIPSRVDRLKGLGNAIVPQVAYELIRHLETDG